LKNVKRQLDLIYPGGYDLSAGKRDGVYVARLKIKLEKIESLTAKLLWTRLQAHRPVLICLKSFALKKFVLTGNRNLKSRAKHKPYDLMQQLTDQELVMGVLQGTPSHQAALYKQYSVPMFRVLLRFARDRAEAEDMLQEGFIRVYRDLGQFRGEGALGGWIQPHHGQHRTQSPAETTRLFARHIGLQPL
jgi:hypothetical protein